MRSTHAEFVIQLTQEAIHGNATTMCTTARSARPSAALCGHAETQFVARNAQDGGLGTTVFGIACSARGFSSLLLKGGSLLQTTKHKSQA